jgi:nitrite reductase (NADH) small subunit
MAATGWVEIGSLDDIPLRGARRVVRPQGAPPVAVFRTGDDEIFALIDRCPHRGGPLSEGIVQGRGVACPLHGWVIELDSGRAEAPDEGCTSTVPVRRDGDRILLALQSCDMADGEPKGAPRWEAV